MVESSDENKKNIRNGFDKIKWIIIKLLVVLLAIALIYFTIRGAIEYLPFLLAKKAVNSI
jgi:flagellar basal body-associated protein FliL